MYIKDLDIMAVSPACSKGEQGSRNILFHKSVKEVSKHT